MKIIASICYVSGFIALAAYTNWQAAVAVFLIVLGALISVGVGIDEAIKRRS